MSTGISKDGETDLIYKSKYPNDVDVAPLIDGQEDERTETHINTLGREACREKGSHKTRIKDFSEKDKDKIYKKLEEWLGPGLVKNPI